MNSPEAEVLRPESRESSDVEARNAEVYQTLDRILHKSRGGFFFLIASPRTQAAALERYKDANLAVYDFAKAKDEGEERHLIQLLRLTQREPDRDVYVFQNFQLAIWDSRARDGIGDWDIDAVHRLNYSRDQLDQLGKRMVFCVTAEADLVLNRHAMDFYDFIKLFLRLEDVPENLSAMDFVPPIDKSVGVDVKVDFNKSDEQLLIQAIALGNQADELRRTFRYNDALHLYMRQLEIREQILGKNDIETAYVYFWIGYVYDDMGKYESALIWYNKALSVWSVNSETENPDVASLNNNIGLVYIEMGEYRCARGYLRKAAAMWEKIYGTDSRQVAKAYNNIGLVYDDMQKYPKALTWYQKAQKIYERVEGSSSSDAADVYENIGRVYRHLKEYSISLKWHHKALVIQQQTLGRRHPVTAITYGNIGVVYEDLGEYEQALEWYKRAFSVQEKVLGKNHQNTKRTCKNIMNLYEAMGDTAAAQLWRKKAEDAQRERNAENNTDAETAPDPTPQRRNPLGTTNPH